MNQLPPGLLATMAIPEQDAGHQIQYTNPQAYPPVGDSTSQEDDENLGGKYKRTTTNGNLKRSPYTRLACFTCREKHQKCEGQRPVCLNCQTKGLQCVYREDRKKKREESDFSLMDEKVRLTEELEQWKRKYSQLKKFVDESVLSNMFTQQLPFPPTGPNMMGVNGYALNGITPGMAPMNPNYGVNSLGGLNSFQLMMLNQGLNNPYQGGGNHHLPPTLNSATLNPVGNPCLSFSGNEGLGPLPNGLGINTIGLTSLEGLGAETFNMAMGIPQMKNDLEKDGLNELSQDPLKLKSPSTHDQSQLSDPFPLESIPAIPYFHDFESPQMIPAILQTHNSNSALFFQNPNGQM